MNGEGTCQRRKSVVYPGGADEEAESGEEEVLSRGGSMRKFHPKDTPQGSLALKVKEVTIRMLATSSASMRIRQGRMRRPGCDRGLPEDTTEAGDKSLAVNKGTGSTLRPKGRVRIDEEKVKEDARTMANGSDHQTRIECEAGGAQYKQLWMVEQIFRSMKSVLSTRPIYQNAMRRFGVMCFAGFLSLLLIKDLQERMEQRGWAKWSGPI